MKIKKIFLIVTFISVCIIAAGYGISPYWFTHTLLGIPDISLNLAHIFRAMMCLYVALGVFWLYSAFNDKYRNMAVLTVLVFAAGLMTGRIVSFIVDGMPGPLLVLYFFIELVYVPVAYWVFKQPE